MATKAVETKKELTAEAPKSEKMAPQPAAKPRGNTALKVGLGLCLGCLVLVILLTVGGFFAGGLAFKNLGIPFLKKAAEEAQKQEALKKLQESQKALEEFSQQGTSKQEEKLPEGFPSDFPLYPGVRVLSSVTGEELGEEGFLVNLETSDDQKEVSSFYKTALPQKGWEITASFDSGDGAVYTIKRAGVNGAVAISQKAGKTEISIALGNM